MADLRGLADGFTSGFNMVDSAISRRKESELRKLAMDQQQQNADRAYDFSKDQFDYRKEADTADRQRQSERDKVGDQRWQTELELNKRNSDRSYGLQAASLQQRREELSYQRAEQKRQQRLEEEKPMAQALYNRLASSDGQWDDEALRLASQISKDNPLNPTRFYGQEKIQAVSDMNKIMPQVLGGQMDYNDPAVIRIANQVLAPHLQRNIGEKDPQTGKEIKSKELAHIGLTEDGQSVIPTLKVTYSDGSAAFRPMTRNGSSDPEDSISPIPLSRLMQEFRGYGQMVGAINSDPSTAEFMNRMLNGDSKNERAEAKEYRTQIINSQKERAKAVAKDPDNAAAINAQFDQLDDQVKQAYGQQPEDRTTPVLQLWAGNDSGKAAFAQKAMAAGVFSSGVTPEQLDAKYDEYQRGQVGQRNRQTAQQLRERAQSQQPTTPPYYTGQ